MVFAVDIIGRSPTDEEKTFITMQLSCRKLCYINFDRCHVGSLGGLSSEERLQICLRTLVALAHSLRITTIVANPLEMKEIFQKRLGFRSDGISLVMETTTFKRTLRTNPPGFNFVKFPIPRK